MIWGQVTPLRLFCKTKTEEQETSLEGTILPILLAEPLWLGPGSQSPFGGTWFQSLFGGTWFQSPFGCTGTGNGAHWFYFYIITALPLLPAPGGQKNNHFYGLIDANLETRKNLLRLFVWNLVAQKLPQSSKVHTGWIQRWPYFSPL